jgi:hypothetical protein
MGKVINLRCRGFLILNYSDGIITVSEGGGESVFLFLKPFWCEEAFLLVAHYAWPTEAQVILVCQGFFILT